MFVILIKIVKVIFFAIFLIYMSTGLAETASDIKEGNEKKSLIKALKKENNLEFNNNSSVITTLLSSSLYLVLDEDLAREELIRNSIDLNKLNLLKDGFEETIDDKNIYFINIKSVDEDDLKLLLSGLSLN